MDDDREVEQEQVSPLDHAAAGRTASLVFAPRARDEIAIDQDLFAQLSTGRGLDHQERVELGHAWPDLRERRRVRRLAGLDRAADQGQLVGVLGSAAACGSPDRG